MFIEDALNDGEDAEVADAVRDHYSPLGPSDTCPTAPVSVAVALAVALGFAARALILPRPDAGQTRRLDGIGVILLAIIVIGLMAGVAPLIDTGWRAVGFWLSVVFAANFGLQLAVFLALRARTSHQVALSIIAGNRNVALFLVALPAATVDALLPFIACYQFPMYLTPLLLGWLHTRSET